MNLELCEKTARRIWNRETPEWGLEENAVVIGGIRVPLLFWRYDRRLTEMRALVGKSVCKLCAYKAVRVDQASTALDTILLRELDICQWLIGKDIVSVYALSNAEKAILALAETAEGVVCAFDLATTLSSETNPVTRHEIIGVEGLITDRAINEQVPVEAVYVFNDKEKNPRTFTDMDMSMLGLTPEEIMTVDYVLELLARPEGCGEIQRCYEKLEKLVACFHESIETGKKVYVEDKNV